MERLIIQVEEIKGNCPVYRRGDRIVLDEGYRLNLEETDNLCLHSLSSILPYYNALFKGIHPKKMGLSRGGNKAYVQCLDPCTYTGGGTVIFGIFKEEPSVEVECHSDYKYAQTPVAFTFQGKRYQIRRILKQWRESSKDFFVVQTPEEKEYTISYEEARDRWHLEKTGKQAQDEEKGSQGKEKEARGRD